MCILCFADDIQVPDGYYINDCESFKKIFFHDSVKFGEWEFFEARWEFFSTSQGRLDMTRKSTFHLDCAQKHARAAVLRCSVSFPEKLCFVYSPKKKEGNNQYFMNI